METLSRYTFLGLVVGLLHVLLVSCECGQPERADSDIDLDDEEQRAWLINKLETKLCFAQQREADVLVYFGTGDDMHLSIRGEAATPDSVSKDRLGKVFEDLQVERDMVVVVRNPIGGGSLDEIENVFRDLGFRRIVIQYSMAFGVVIERLYLAQE